MTEQKRFIDNGDGTVTDTKTNLIWDKSGSSIMMDYEEAIIYADKLKLAGRKWWVPTIVELCTPVNYSKYNPAINNIFSCKSDDYWSSTTYAGDTSSAWVVYFYDGYMYYNDKTDTYYVRCVAIGS